MKQTRRNGRRSRVALMLLVLVAYASLIGATHHHGNHGKVGQPASDSAISSGEDKNSSGAPSSSDPSSCPTCRLQRNFNSVLRAPSVLFDLRPQSLSYEIGPRDPQLLAACVVFSSRGPPLV